VLRRYLKYALPIALSALVAAIFAWGTIRLTVPRLVGVEVRRDIPAEILSPIAPAHVVRASLGGVDPYAFCANEQGLQKRFYVNCPPYNAQGDDTTDDTAAFTSANVAAQAVGGTLYAINPPIAYKTTSEIPVHGAAHWKCDGGLTPANCIVRSHSVMRSTIELRTTFADPTGGVMPPRSTIEGFTFDANSLASSAVLLNGAFNVTLKSVRAINSLNACVRNGNVQVPYSIGTITPTVPGGSPSGITVTVADGQYTGIPAGLSGGTFNLVIKVIDTGALDVGTFSTSFDNGATFLAFKQPISHAANVGRGDNSGNLSVLTGLVANFPAGTYHAGDKWAFPVTIPLGDYSQALAANSRMIFDDVTTQHCGSIFASAGRVATYNAYNVTSTPGTVAFASGSPLLIGTSTTWTSIPGSGSSRGAMWVNSGGGLLFQVLGVLSDTVAAITIGTEPKTSASGVDYGLGEYGGYYEDGLSEGSENLFIHGQSNLDSTCMAFAGGTGPNVIAHEYSGCALTAVAVGGSAADGTFGAKLDHTRVDSQSNNGYLLSPNSFGTIIEPLDLTFGFAGLAQGWIYQGHGGLSSLSNPSGANSWLPMYNQVLRASSQFLSTAGQQIALPDATALANTGHTGYIQISSSAPLILNGSPTIPYPGIAGEVLVIRNSGSFPITWQPDTLQSTGLQLESAYVEETTSEIVAFISTGAPFGEMWREIWHERSYAEGMGNDGTGRRRIVTSNNTPTEIYRADVVNGFVATGTALRFQTQCNSQNGVNWAYWSGLYGSDTTGTSIFTVDLAMGSGAGNTVPLGWTFGSDASGTTPYARLLFAGDNTANPVTCKIVVEHRDGSQ
jgi:hypothetical protein